MQHRSEIVSYLEIGKTNHAERSSFEERGAVSVLRFPHFVLLAVEFYYESPFEAAEVSDQWAERALSAEFKIAELPRAQMRS